MGGCSRGSGGGGDVSRRTELNNFSRVLKSVLRSSDITTTITVFVRRCAQHRAQIISLNPCTGPMRSVL